MPCNLNRCHILQVDTRNQKFYYKMNGTNLESVRCVKDTGVTIAFRLKFSQKCKDAAGKANRRLGLININFSFKNKNVILPLCIRLVQGCPTHGPRPPSDFLRQAISSKTKTKQSPYLTICLLLAALQPFPHCFLIYNLILWR